MSIYDIPAVDATVRNSSQTLELELVGSDKSVLDVGCATGYLARALVDRGCAGLAGLMFSPGVAGVRGDLLPAALGKTTANHVHQIGLLLGREAFDRVKDFVECRGVWHQ